MHVLEADERGSERNGTGAARCVYDSCARVPLQRSYYLRDRCLVRARRSSRPQLASSMMPLILSLCFFSSEKILQQPLARVSGPGLALQVPLLQNRSLFQAICPDSFWARDNMCFLSRVQRLAEPAGGQRHFVLVGDTNREQRPLFCPGWWLQPGQKALDI